MLSELDHHLERARVQEVADQHAGLLPNTAFAVCWPRRRPELSTTSSCSSVAVWMNSMMAADATGRLAASATGARGEQHGERAQPFAAVVDDVVCDLVDERDVAAEAADDRAVDVGPVLADRDRSASSEGTGGRGFGEGHAERMMPDARRSERAGAIARAAGSRRLSPSDAGRRASARLTERAGITRIPRSFATAAADALQESLTVYAVFRTGGKQYRASQVERVRVEKLDAAVGEPSSSTRC